MLKRETPRVDFKHNLIGYYLSIVVIFIGYVLLALGGADSFTSRTLGPVVIVIGFIFAVPAAHLFKSSGKPDASDVPGTSQKPKSSSRPSGA
jgi:hypothetical protein